MARIYAVVDKKWEDVISRWTEEKLKCTKCGNFFYEINNIGAWKCSQHAHERHTNASTRWPCCDKIYRGVPGMASLGCVRADHTTLEVNFTEEHDISIPITLKNYITVYGQSVIENNDALHQNKIKIRRFDWKTADKLGRNDIYPRS